MKSFAEFWKHDAPSLPCCLFIEDDEAVADHEAYNCDACPVADALDDLAIDQENAEAWQLFGRCVSRFTVDTHLAGTVFARLTGELSVEEFTDLAARFTLLYDALYPPDKRES